MPHPVPQIITTDVAVIGGGIVGLGIAWEAQRAGHTVTVIDPAPATGATFAAAGMLAPVSELHYQEEDLLELTLASAARWPEFVASLPAGSTHRIQHLPHPGVGCRPRRPEGAGRSARCPGGSTAWTWPQLTIREARALEPMVGPHISCAYKIAAGPQR